MIVNYSNSQRAGVILYLTALILGAYEEPPSQEYSANLQRQPQQERKHSEHDDVRRPPQLSV